MARWHRRLFLVAMILGLITSREAWVLNFHALRTARALFIGSPLNTRLEAQLMSTSCPHFWLAIVQAKYASVDFLPQAKVLLSTCPGRYVVLLHGLAPESQALAETAVSYRPDVAISWFWLVEVRGGYRDCVLHNVNKQNWQEIATLLQHGLRLAPHDGLRWRLLGDVLRPYAPQKAIKAYLQSCHNGDPGSNGCYRAGLLAEELGDYRSAIRYYRLSRWEGAHRRADRVEWRLLTDKHR